MQVRGAIDPPELPYMYKHNVMNHVNEIYAGLTE